MANSVSFYDLEASHSIYRISKSDIALIRKYEKNFKSFLPEFIEDFYEWMAELPEYVEMFSKQNVITRVKKSQSSYWMEVFQAQIDKNYVDKRFHLGRVHATINLPLTTYLAGVSCSAQLWLSLINNEDCFKEDRAQLLVAISKLITYDSSIVSESYTQETSSIIQNQSQSLLDLSTPTIELWSDLLVLPIIGVLDSSRVQNMTVQMLEKVLATESKVVILDIQGVPSMDSSVANHIIKMTRSCKLLGAQCIISGISVPIAQTLVAIGIDLDAVTKATLKEAFKEALILTDHKVSKITQD